MTYREKLLKVHSEEGVKEIVKAYCPSDCFETASDLRECNLGRDDVCERCWSQQIPQDEQDIEEVTISAYAAGTEDAKRTVLKICNQTLDDSTKMFGLTILHEILEKFSMTEILEKFETYKKELQVGDVVQFSSGDMGIVTYISDTTVAAINKEGVFVTLPYKYQKKWLKESAMKRLTNRFSDGTAFVPENIRQQFGMQSVYDSLADYEDLELTPEQIKEIDKLYREKCEELSEYKNLEEQGKLVLFPTYAYFIKNNKVYKGWVQEVTHCVYRKPLYDIRYDDNSLANYRGYVGVTVFLAKEEAEQKLKELQEKKL